ncbi:MAG TPA: D-alanyl-D-alanine carboxypeptidase/D-alanyl-D-alanine-endopeptidase, partial [Rhodothermales bacterium]|nr:D-alanyl-D-alanine carboxypeptidase/D-alanyl-D-alanine-endopeptidase [Rhodothermales bacterium]
LYARNAQRSFMPASNAKLYTTAAALDLYGTEFRFTTTLYAAGPVEGGTLRGDLVLRGGGDPTLGGAYFSEQDSSDRLAAFRAFADSLRARGITRIEGAIVGDDDVYDDVPLGYAWSWDDIPYYYSAEMSGLSFFDNTVDLTIAPGEMGQPGVLSWEPLNTPYVSFINRTETREAGFGVREGYARPMESNTITLTSRFGRDTRDPETLTVHNPTRYAAFVLRSVLQAAGITVTGDAEDLDDRTTKPDYGTATRVASWRSAPMARIVEGVNKESINLWADLLLKHIGTHAAGPRATERMPMGSHERGLAVAKRVWARMGVDTVRTELVDGSGLSRLDLVNPASTVALLRAMHRHPDAAVREAFRASLPIGGADGTLRNRFREGRANRNVRAKTGSLGAVSSLGGYVTTRSGRVLAFAIMVNHYTTSSSTARAVQDDAVEVLAGLQ